MRNYEENIVSLAFIEGNHYKNLSSNLDISLFSIVLILFLIIYILRSVFLILITIIFVLEGLCPLTRLFVKASSRYFRIVSSSQLVFVRYWLAFFNQLLISSYFHGFCLPFSHVFMVFAYRFSHVNNTEETCPFFNQIVITCNVL